MQLTFQYNWYASESFPRSRALVCLIILTWLVPVESSSKLMMKLSGKYITHKSISKTRAAHWIWDWRRWDGPPNIIIARVSLRINSSRWITRATCRVIWRSTINRSGIDIWTFLLTKTSALHLLCLFFSDLTCRLWYPPPLSERGRNSWGVGTPLRLAPLSERLSSMVLGKLLIPWYNDMGVDLPLSVWSDLAL